MKASFVKNNRLFATWSVILVGLLQASTSFASIYSDEKFEGLPFISPNIDSVKIGPCDPSVGTNDPNRPDRTKRHSFETCKNFIFDVGPKKFSNYKMVSEPYVEGMVYSRSNYPGYYFRQNCTGCVPTTITYGKWWADQVVPQANCSFELEEFKRFSFERDTDGDGEPDQCYNPDDFLKVAKKANEFCPSEPNAYTLDDAQDSKIKSAATLAKQSLERMEADLAAPNEFNADKLNQIASLFGMTDYKDPQFAMLTSVIQLGSIGCVKNKLEAASLDPSGNGYLSFEDSNGGVSGVHCKDKNGDDIIQVHVKDISHFHPVYANQSMQELLVHETQHACNDVHPDEMHYMKDNQIRNEFVETVAAYKRLIDSGSEFDMLERLVENPYYFEYLLEVYL